MDFQNSKPIYVQIADSICDQILSGRMTKDSRVPSVREYAAELGVNPNTVARSFEKLTDQGIIYNKRGIGYFVCETALEAILTWQRAEFIEEVLPEIRRRADILGLDLKTLL